MNVRRITDLDLADIDVLISLCATRIHTVNNSLQKHSISDKSGLIKAHKQLEITLAKLKKMKERNRNVH